MKFLLMLFLLTSCASYDPCLEKHPHNEISQKNCREVRNKEMGGVYRSHHFERGGVRF